MTAPRAPGDAPTRRAGSATRWRRGTLLPLLLVAAVAAWGSYLRLAELGRDTLRTDETIHYYVAQSLLRGEGHVLPSGELYPRGPAYSWQVAWALDLTDPPERAVRLPAAIAGCLGIIVFTAVAWAWGGPWAAVWAALLFVIYPEGLRLSRLGRFYSLQLVFGIAALFTAWYTLRDAGAPVEVARRGYGRRWLAAGGTILALLAARSLQVTTLSVAAAWGACLAAVAAADVRGMGPRLAARWSVPLQLSLAGAAAALGVLLLAPGEIDYLVWATQAMPYWARASAGEASPFTAYYRALSGDEPVVIAAAPAMLVVTALKHPRLALYLSVWFGLPILLHSTILAWKGERFVLLAIPALFLVVAIGAAEGTKAAYQAILRLAERRSRLPERWRRRAAGTTVAVVGGVTLLLLPSFNAARKSLRPAPSEGWREAAALVRSRPELAALPYGAASPLPAKYYWRRVDFAVQIGLLETWIPRLGPPWPGDDSTQAGPFVWKHVGSPDVYAGVPVLTTPESIRARFAERGEVVIGFDERYVRLKNLEPSLYETLEREAEELCRGRCGSMLLYHWRLRP